MKCLVEHRVIAVKIGKLPPDSRRLTGMVNASSIEKRPSYTCKTSVLIMSRLALCLINTAGKYIKVTISFNIMHKARQTLIPCFSSAGSKMLVRAGGHSLLVRSYACARSAPGMKIDRKLIFSLRIFRPVAIPPPKTNNDFWCVGL